MKIIFFKNKLFLKTNYMNSYNFVFFNENNYKLHLKQAVYSEISNILNKLFSTVNIYFERDELKLKSDVNYINNSSQSYVNLPVNYLLEITPFFDNINIVKSPLLYSETFKILYPNEDFKITFKIYNKIFEINFLKIMENFNRYENNTFEEYFYIYIPKYLNYDINIKSAPSNQYIDVKKYYLFTFNKFPTFLEYELI